MKHLSKCLMALAGAFACSLGWAVPADPVALWKDFTGLTSEQALLPDRSSTQEGLPGQEWLFNLGAGSVTDGVLQTGTGISPSISFGEQLAFGYNSGEKHATVIIAVQAPVTLVQNKPFIHLTNNNTGVGVAMYNATTLRGSWGTNYWGNQTNNKTAVTIDDLTTATDVVYIALATNTGNSGDNITRVAIVDPDANTVTWTSISGLFGSGINVTDIRFGNYTSTATGGLDYKLLSAAVYEGRATDETLLSFVTARTANDMAFTTSGACTRVASGATLTLSDGVTLDLGGATFGEETVTIALAEGATSATVHIYTADKAKLNDLPEGVTLVETRPDTTIVWDNTQTTWSADTEWTIDGTETPTTFQEGDTVVFNLTEDTTIILDGSWNPEAIVVKGKKLTFTTTSQQTTTVHTSTTLENGGSLDVSNVGNSSATHLKAVTIDEGCTFIGNPDQTTSVTGSGEWCYVSGTTQYSSTHANLTIRVGNGATFKTASPATAATFNLILEGGATYRNESGNTNWCNINSPITVVNAPADNPAKINGVTNGNYSNLKGVITVEADSTLKLINGLANSYTISGQITGDGALICADTDSAISITNTANDFTGGLTVSQNNLTVASVGAGDVTIDTGYTLTASADAVIASGKSLKGAGTLAGNVSFADGAIIDAAQTVAVNGAITSVGTAKIKLAEAPAEGTTAIKVLTATSVTLPFEATIVYGDDETELTGWVTTSEADNEETIDVNEAGLYIIKADTIKETTLTPVEGETLTWAGAWGDSAPGETEAATLIVTQDVTLDIGTTELLVGAVTIKKGEVETTPTLTLANMANFAPSGILLEGVNLAFAGTTEADASTRIDYPIMGVGAVAVTGGSVTLTSTGNTFDGGITIAAGATVTTEVVNHSAFGTGTITVEGTLNANMYGCFIGAGQIIVKQGGVLNGVNNVTWGARIHLEEGAVANFSTQYGLSTDSGQTAGVFTGAGTVNVTYLATSNYANPADATFKNSTEWTGTVKFASSDLRNLTFAQYGNANSTLEFAGLTGWNNGGSVTVKKVIISGEGWKVNNGGSSATTTFNAPFEGTAPMIFEGSTASQVYQFLGDMSGYTGNIKVVSNFGVTFGDVALGNNGNDYGVIVIKEGVTTAIAPSVTWEAGNTTTGLRLNGILDVTTGTGLSTIKGPITGSGTIKIGEGRSLKVTGTVADTVAVSTDVEGKEVISSTDDAGATTYTLGVPFTPVAEVGGVQYETLQAALDAGGTVTLLADVELTAFVRITTDVTLALNGKTITAPLITSGGAIVIGDYNNGQTFATVTITGEGAITSAAYCVNISYGKLTIDSDATFTGVDTAVQIQRGELVINKGTYQVTPGEGNSFGDYRYTINKLDKYATEATVIINGGKYYKFNPADNAAEGAGTNFAPAGYIGQQDADGWYTLVKAPIDTGILPTPPTEGTEADIKVAVSGETEVVEIEKAAYDAIVTAANGTMVKEITVAPVVDGGIAPTAQAAVDAAALIADVVTVDADGKATISYAFGITAIDVVDRTPTAPQLKITVKAQKPAAEQAQDGTVTMVDLQMLAIPQLIEEGTTNVVATANEQEEGATTYTFTVLLADLYKDGVPKKLDVKLSK